MTARDEISRSTVAKWPPFRSCRSSPIPMFDRRLVLATISSSDTAARGRGPLR